MAGIPVILDTDIGGDVDDTWALAFMLRCPELDVRLVVTDTGDTVYRARIAARMLQVAGRTDVPVGVGTRFYESDGGEPQWDWAADYDLDDYPGVVREDGVDALIEAVMGGDGQMTLVCIGPVPNVAEALRREPAVAERARFVGMHGSVRLGYGGSPEPAREANVANHTEACQAVFAAPWAKTITPLDTCGLVHLEGERYRAVAESPDPLPRAVIQNYRIWRPGWDAGYREGRSSTLFDTVAVYLAFSEEHLVMEDLPIRVTDDGYTRVEEGAPLCRVATAWRDMDAFLDLLAARLS
jgi:inosine-uridine nucleoside N-ribohydrolase